MNKTNCVVQTQGDLNHSGLKTLRGLRQRDNLTCLLFNTAIEKIVLNYKIQTSYPIYNRIVQVLGCVYDLDTVARSLPSLKEVFLSLIKIVKEMGQCIYEEKY